jgi:hypothetical protein
MLLQSLYRKPGAVRDMGWACRGPIPGPHTRQFFLLRNGSKKIKIKTFGECLWIKRIHEGRAPLQLRACITANAILSLGSCVHPRQHTLP